jgi:hypothetical protein
MYLTVHAAAGLLIASATPNPIFGFAAGLVSHLALDLVPHGDELPTHFVRPQVLRRLLGAALLDGTVVAALLVVYYLAGHTFSTTTFATLAGALLPDALEGAYLITQTKGLAWFSRFHGKIHNFTKVRLGWQFGMLIQCLTLTALWLLAL